MDHQIEQQKAASQIAYYDDLISGYLATIDHLNAPGASDESKILIKLATESIEHCEDKKAILVNYLSSLKEP